MGRGFNVCITDSVYMDFFLLAPLEQPIYIAQVWVNEGLLESYINQAYAI